MDGKIQEICPKMEFKLPSSPPDNYALESFDKETVQALWNSKHK